MIFRLQADAVFTADSITDAIEALGRHFLSNYDSDVESSDSESIFISGEVSISPVGMLT